MHSNIYIDFVKKFLNLYLVDRNFKGVVNLLKSEISWIGTGRHEICYNFTETLNLMDMEKQSWAGHFHILKECYDNGFISDDLALIYAQLTLEEHSERPLLIKLNIRGSFLCCKEQDGTVKMLHAHVSIPDQAQGEFEFTRNNVLDEYIKDIEKELNVNTSQLNSKTLELELLIANLREGVSICKFDESQTIVYMNQGVCNIIGYSEKEVNTLFGNKHCNLISMYHREYMRSEINKQLINKGNYSVEYSIITKNGDIIWLIDKGSLSDNGELIYRVLLDITDQHEQKEQLSISEKRYEIAINNSKNIIFDYIIHNKQLLVSEVMTNKYGIISCNKIDENTLVKNWKITRESVGDFIVALKLIDKGNASSNAIVVMYDLNLAEQISHITLTNIIDENGIPIRAVGVISDVTAEHLLEKEKQYVRAITSKNLLTIAADITSDTIFSSSGSWTQLIECGHGNSYTFAVYGLISSVVRPESRDLMSYFLNKKRLSSNFYQGILTDKTEFKRAVSKGESSWVGITIDLVKDALTGNINVFVQIRDVDQHKMAEKRVLQEQHFYETMRSKVYAVYEANITKDIYISGNEKWFNNDESNIINSSYTEYFDEFINNKIHKEDKQAFIESLGRENLIDVFEQGREEVYIEYRKLDDDGQYYWYACTTHMLRDTDTSDIRIINYLQNIHQRKSKEQELLYLSQHDGLTNTYNKITTQTLIEDFLINNTSKQAIHSFLIIDFDDFKMVNDSFGHAFGDSVLSEVASKMKSALRDKDILGRIGGDEFSAFIKNVSSVAEVSKIAQRLCKCLNSTFTSNNMKCEMSGSVGVSIFPHDGDNFEELYKKADMALYAAKSKGKNRHVIYNENLISLQYQPRLDDFNVSTENGNFYDNVSEYVFNILNNTNDLEDGMEDVLELLSKYFGSSRGYIFENSNDKLFFSNTFEWCVSKNFSIKDLSQNLSYSYYSYDKHFEENDIYFISDVDKSESENEHEKALLKAQDVKSMLMCALKLNGEYLGFVGFDDCVRTRISPPKESLATIRNASKVIASFLVSKRSEQDKVLMSATLRTVMDNINCYIYVIKQDDYKLLYLNSKCQSIFPNAKIGDYCYKSFQGFDEKCKRCPVLNWKNSESTYNSIEIYSDVLDVWVEATVSQIDWINGEKASLINCMDISKYKKDKLPKNKDDL